MAHTLTQRQMVAEFIAGWQLVSSIVHSGRHLVLTKESKSYTGARSAGHGWRTFSHVASWTASGWERAPNTKSKWPSFKGSFLGTSRPKCECYVLWLSTDQSYSLRNTQVTNYNVQTSPSMMQKLQKKARKFGLYDLAAILFTELEGTKTLLIDQQKKFAERFVKPAPKQLVAVAAITKRSRRSLA